MTKKRRCFVIMPFSKTTDEHTEEYWTKHFTDYLKPLIEQSRELEAYRSEALREDILKGIITSLVTVPIVVADLTDYNYNVFWELGVRQSFKHGTITIAEVGTKFPFDLGAKSTLLYFPKDHLKNKEFEKKFLKAITDCLEHPERPDSHVLETISGRGTLFEIIRRDEAIRRLDAVINECQHNLEIMDRIKVIIEEKSGVPTYRLRHSALELLVTNRYIDQDDAFYETAELNLSLIHMQNGQLSSWEIHQEPVIDWFEKHFKNNKEIFEEFLEAIIESREELIQRF